VAAAHWAASRASPPLPRATSRKTSSSLLRRYGRSTLEEVFLDVARGNGGEAREAAQ